MRARRGTALISNTSRRTVTERDNRSDAAVKQIGIRVPADLNDQLETIAKRERNGVSAVCRRLLVTALAATESDIA